MQKADWNVRDGTYRLCISAQLPGGGAKGDGAGIWPAHWQMPNDSSCDPDEGEPDIMEMVNGDPVVYQTYHWQQDWPAQNCTYPTGHLEHYISGAAPVSWDSTYHEYQRSTYLLFTLFSLVCLNVISASYNRIITSLASLHNTSYDKFI